VFLQSELDKFTADEWKAEEKLAPPLRRARRHANEYDEQFFTKNIERMAALVGLKELMPLGTVHTVPGSFKNPIHDCVRDWALFKLIEDRTHTIPRNVVSVGNPKIYQIYEL
jgi:hypothetical protein